MDPKEASRAVGEAWSIILRAHWPYSQPCPTACSGCGNPVYTVAYDGAYRCEACEFVRREKLLTASHHAVLEMAKHLGILAGPDDVAEKVREVVCAKLPNDDIPF